MVLEATLKLSKEEMELFKRHPKHPGILKSLGLDGIPANSVVVVGRDRIEVLLPRDRNLRETI